MPLITAPTRVKAPQSLTEHVERADGVCLERFDGVVHVVGRRGRRRQVIDLVHCKERGDARSDDWIMSVCFQV